ncbi:MAG: hypothetical protein AAGI22_18400 [Planctomycetota bacterium]
MPDPASTLATIIDTAKKLREVAKKVQDAEVRNLVADLNLQLADLKLELAASREELATAREEIIRLNETVATGKVKVDLRSKIERRGKLYYLKEPVAGYDEGPYCVACFDGDGKLVLVSKLASTFKDLASHMCPKCEATY